MGRKKQEFPFSSYARIATAIRNGMNSPSEMENNKVLSHSKLHKYLKLFTDMGFLIRNRLPKHGNHVEYHLNYAQASQHPFWRLFYEKLIFDENDNTPQLCNIPLRIIVNKKISEMETKKRKKELRKKFISDMERDELLVLIKNFDAPIPSEEEYIKFRTYPIFEDFEHKLPLEKRRDIMICIIKKVKNQIICPNCLMKARFSDYEEKGFDCFQKLRVIEQENIVYCPNCHYQTQFEQLKTGIFEDNR